MSNEPNFTYPGTIISRNDRSATLMTTEEEQDIIFFKGVIPRETV